jgi:chaperonin GroEL
MRTDGAELQERLSKMIGGVSIIHVGGNNETEMSEKKDRVDDALQATKAALEEGIIPGGGCALLYAREILDRKDLGSRIVYNACGKPFETILKNAGFEYQEISSIINKLKPQSTKNYWLGYNIKEQKIVNMKDAGIIDPTKVCRVALSNAGSVSSTILLTECIIVDIPEEQKSPEMDMSQFM